MSRQQLEQVMDAIRTAKGYGEFEVCAFQLGGSGPWELHFLGIRDRTTEYGVIADKGLRHALAAEARDHGNPGVLARYDVGRLEIHHDYGGPPGLPVNVAAPGSSLAAHRVDLGLMARGIHRIGYLWSVSDAVVDLKQLVEALTGSPSAPARPVVCTLYVATGDGNCHRIELNNSPPRPRVTNLNESVAANHPRTYEPVWYPKSVTIDHSLMLIATHFTEFVKSPPVTFVVGTGYAGSMVSAGDALRLTTDGPVGIRSDFEGRIAALVSTTAAIRPGDRAVGSQAGTTGAVRRRILRRQGL